VTAALAGLRILDLTRLLPGGYATMLLADLGAEVLKIEEPTAGDYLRAFPPYLPDGVSGGFAALNRGKRSMTLNLRSADGAALLRDLAADADAVVESFRPGVMDRLGVGYEALRMVNPRLVYVAISGFGTDGPYAQVAGHDIDYLAYAGALSYTGTTAGPAQPGVQIADVGGGGQMAVIALLAALQARARTGEGQFCDVSMTDGALSWQAMHIGFYAAGGDVPRPGGGLLGGGFACYGVYECADGRHVAVGALEPQFFRVLLEVLQLPELFAAHLDPSRQDELRERLTAAFAAKPREEWVAAFAGRDACVAPVLDLAEALADPGARARGMVLDEARPDGTTMPTVGVAPRLAGTPGRVGGPAPGLGEHTDEVLATLGRTPEQVAALHAAGVV
jgi:crotonobetainyl-CoA:carnitine CoA-transferase CaiB-like acyl-CoA transferase